MLDIKYGYRAHCGGLHESLETKKYVTQTYFTKLVSEYEYYGFDERCDQFLFKLRDIDKKLSCFHSDEVCKFLQRFWLFIEVEPE